MGTFDLTVIPYQQSNRIFEVMNTEEYLAHTPKLVLENIWSSSTLSGQFKNASTHLSPSQRIFPMSGHNTNGQIKIRHLPITARTKQLTTSLFAAYYPFRSLFTGRIPEEHEFTVSTTQNGFILHQIIPPSVNTHLISPPLAQKELYVPGSLSLEYIDSKIVRMTVEPLPYSFVNSSTEKSSNKKTWTFPTSGARQIEILLNSSSVIKIDASEKNQQAYVMLSLIAQNFFDVLNEKQQPLTNVIYKTSLVQTPMELTLQTNDLSVPIYATKGFTGYKSSDDLTFFDHSAHNCESVLPTKQQVVTDSNGQWLSFSSQDSQQCFDIILPSLPHNTGYLMEVVSKHQEGKPLQLAVINHQSLKSDIEVALKSRTETVPHHISFYPLCNQTDRDTQ